MDTFNMVAIDPGTSTVGVSIYTINAVDLSIVAIETILIDTTIRFRERDLVKDVLVRLQTLHFRTMEIIEHYKPKIVSIEAAFLFRLRPAAYGPLSQSIMAIELAVYNVNPLTPIWKFAPKTIKKVTTSGGAADKNDMLEGVLLLDEITAHVNPNLISEHEVDALGINYTMLQHLRENQALLLMAY